MLCRKMLLTWLFGSVLGFLFVYKYFLLFCISKGFHSNISSIETKRRDFKLRPCRMHMKCIGNTYNDLDPVQCIGHIFSHNNKVSLRFLLTFISSATTCLDVLSPSPSVLGASTMTCGTRKSFLLTLTLL